MPELEKRGQVFFQANYGETADYVQDLLDRIYPDMGEHAMLLSMPSDSEELRRVVQQHNCLWVGVWL